MANVLHVYKEVEIVNEYRRGEAGRQLISYGEKPVIQALATTTPDSASPGRHESQSPPGWRVCTTGHGVVIGRTGFAHRRSELSATHTPAAISSLSCRSWTAPIGAPSNSIGVGQPFSAHLQRDSRLSTDHAPTLRFCFHSGSWLVAESDRESISKMARTMLRGIRVARKQDLIDRIHQYFEEINSAPVVFRWKHKTDETIIV